MPKLVYSVREVADVLGVSRWLVQRLIANGELPAVRLGERRIVVPKKALEDYLEDSAAAS